MTAKNIVVFTLSASTTAGASKGFATIAHKGVSTTQFVDLGRGTQPEAMYKITIAALEHAQRVQKLSVVPIRFEIIVDQLTCTQLLGTAKCKAANLQPLLAQALEAMNGISVVFGTPDKTPAEHLTLPVSESPVAAFSAISAVRGAEIAPWD